MPLFLLPKLYISYKLACIGDSLYNKVVYYLMNFSTTYKHFVKIYVDMYVNKLCINCGLVKKSIKKFFLLMKNLEMIFCKKIKN